MFGLLYGMFWQSVVLMVSILTRGFGSRLHLQLTDFFFHLFARFERHHELLRNKNFVSRSWIPRLPSGSFLDFENSKIPQFNSPVFHERLDDCIERLLDDLFRLELRHPEGF